MNLISTPHSTCNDGYDHSMYYSERNQAQGERVMEEFYDKRWRDMLIYSFHWFRFSEPIGQGIEPSISLCQSCLMPEHDGECQLIDLAAANLIKVYKP